MSAPIATRISKKTFVVNRQNCFYVRGKNFLKASLVSVKADQFSWVRVWMDPVIDDDCVLIRGMPRFNNLPQPKPTSTTLSDDRIVITLAVGDNVGVYDVDVKYKFIP